MLAWSVLALCAIGVVRGTTATTTTTKNRDRRSTFLDIVKERSSESSYKFPVLPVELPIQLGGHGGVNIPVLVLPVPVPVYMKSDSCEAHQTIPAPVENDSSSFIIPPYVAARFHDDVPITRKPTISLDDYLNDNPSPVVVSRPTNRPPPKLVTIKPPPITEPVSNYVTGSLFPDPGPPREPKNGPPPKLVTTEPSPITEPVSNYVTGSLFPDPGPPRKPKNDPPPKLVTTEPPPITEPVNNYVTGSLFPDPSPPRKPKNGPSPKLVATEPPPITEPVNNYVTGSLFPDPGPPRKPKNGSPPKLITTEPPPITEPVSNYVTGSLFPDPGPPRKPKNDPPPKLVTTEPPPITEPVNNYVTGSLFPDPGPPRKPKNGSPPKLITTEPPPITEPVSNYVTGSLFPDPAPPRKTKNAPPPKLVTTEPPPITEPVSNYVTGSLIPDLPPPRKQPYPLHQNPAVINKVENVEHVVEEREIPYSEGRGQIFATSAELIQSFRQETPEAPELPAVIPRGRRFPDRIPPTEPDAPLEAAIFAPSPPRPDFGRSMRLRIDLTVPRSDYTEVYDIHWHAESNTACTEIEDGAMVIYRVPLLDGRMQFLKVQEDRLNGSAVRRCTMSPLLPATPADKTFPGLPDLSLFNFVGYTAAEDWSLVERWSHWVIGKPGEGGAARGESLNFSHDFFMYRDGGDAMPLKYTVVTHSSVLGPACDSYTHRYRLLSEPTSPSLPDMSQCDVTEELKEERRQRRDIRDLVSGTFSAVNDFFNPIGEFLGLTRHPKYDSMFDNYKGKFRRNYRDSEEEAVRKQQFIKTNRFVEAANRIAVTFATGVNAFADRVKEEIKWLFGAVPPPPGVAPPPGSAPEFDFGAAIMLAKGLPENFDWTIDRNFKSPVRHQGECMSCWAFAVAGATEGALYNKTNKIVPLSPQSMVDCGDSYDVMGCNGGWPLNAFGYVKKNGLPSWEEYMYKAEVAIYNRAPTVVVLKANVNSFISLQGDGVLDDTRCSKDLHAVLAVGWGTRDGDTHFTIKNSWSETWADMGYGRVASDYCGIRDHASYPVVKKPDIDRNDLQVLV